MARLDEILQELDAAYSPQRQSIQTRLDALPAQADAEIAGLKAAQTDAFGEILGGARDRNMGFSGQPIAEQSRYTASQFLPAVARVRQSQNESRQGLFDALNNINLQRNQFGQQLYQTELDRAEQARQFDRQLAAQRSAAGAQSNVLSGLFGNTPAPQTQGARSAAPVQITPQTQALYNSVRSMLNTGDQQRILREFNAIASSAGFGNANDRMKLQLLYQLNPDLFRGRQNALKLAGVA